MHNQDATLHLSQRYMYNSCVRVAQRVCVYIEHLKAMVPVQVVHSISCHARELHENTIQYMYAFFT